MAAELGWVVQFYPAQRDLEDLAERLMALPGPVVLDHFGAVPADGGIDQPAFRTMLRMLDSGRSGCGSPGPMRCTQEDFPYP